MSMSGSTSRTAAALAALALVTASCRWNVGTVDVYLVYNAVPEKNPLANIDQLKVRIEGPDMMPRERTIPVGSAKGSGLDDVPPGKDRVLIVEGLDGSGRVLSRGVSRPFDVKEGRTGIFLFFSTKGAFSPPPAGSNRGWDEMYTTSMHLSGGTTGRAFSAAASLPEGLVLLAGGLDPAVSDPGAPGQSEISRAADLFDPTAGAFLALDGVGNCTNEAEPMCMSAARVFHCAAYVEWMDRVLLVGGEPIESPYAEVFDQREHSFTPGPAPNVPRSRHAAALVRVGKNALLVAGGKDRLGNVLDSVEVLVEGEQDFKGAAPLGAARFASASTAVDQGLIVTGGFEDEAGEKPTRRVDLISWDQDSGFSTSTYSDCLVEARAWHTAVTVQDKAGKQWVFVCGGITDGPQVSKSCEIINPDTLESEPAPENIKLFYPRWAHTATVLPNQKVLVAGGFSNLSATAVLQNAVLLDPVGGEYNLSVLPMNSARAGHTAVLMSNNMVLLAGGMGQDHTAPVWQYEIYNP